MALVCWMPLNGTLDNIGCSGITVTNNGATVDNSGKIGKCYYFSGSTWIKMTMPEEMTTIKNTSVCAWVKSTGSVVALGGISHDSGPGQAHMTLYTSGWQFAGGSAYKYVSGGTIANTSVWHHVCCTLDDTTITTYLDGTKVTSKTLTEAGVTVTDLTSANFLEIGCDHPGGNEFLTGYVNDFRVYDHCLSAAEVREIAQGLMLHYPLNRQSLKPIGTNLVTGVTKGGQTTLLTDGRIGVVTSGTSADTYFTVNLSESITNGTTYYLSCDVSGVSEGQYWGFPLGAQSNTSMPSKFYNGHNEYIFTANNINWGTNRLFLDDNYRNDYAHPASFYNFVLIKNPTFTAVDGSGFGHNGTSNAPITTSEDTSRYEEASYFGAYNTPVLTINNFSTIAPALTSCTITWWGKYDTTTTLLLTGQSTSYYIAASANNNYYHANIGSPTMYKDGVAGTYKCAADGWHHFALTGVNLSTWTTLKLNGYSSSWPLKGYISDFRIYSTVLNADAIRQLYEVGAKVDNKKNWHTFEFIEENTEKVTKQGLTKGHNIIEPYIPLYDKTIYTEPDGSTWIRIFHHNNPAASKFSSPETDWLLGKYLDTDRWYDVDRAIYNSLSPYEFMVKQKTTSSSAETKYRWQQTANPLTATWNDVKPGTPTFITTTGYTSSSMGGLYIFKTSQLHMSIANSTSSNWYGGIGCAAAYNGGIPGYPNTTVTSGYIDLYIRIYNNAKIIKGIGINAHNFIEL